MPEHAGFLLEGSEFMRMKVWLGVLLLSGSAQVYADYETGLAEFRQGNFASAVHEWREAAGQGEGQSQFALGQMFENGSGVRASQDEAYKWYRLAAGSGSVEAQVKLAQWYLAERVEGFFVVSCGFGLIEQAAHRAANQVDHGDEVGLVPVAACA